MKREMDKKVISDCFLKSRMMWGVRSVSKQLTRDSIMLVRTSILL